MLEATCQARTIALRPIEACDAAFLRSVYASTRVEELAPLGLNQTQVDAFLDMQFEAQRQDYWRNYDTARFCIVTCDGVDAGRLYVERHADELRVIDIALLPPFRGRGIGGGLLTQLFVEADAASLLVCIHVEYNNPAQRLYLRLGFAFCGEPIGVYRKMQRLPQGRQA
jgi:GNAT superfamily N-acetyltransferase